MQNKHPLQTMIEATGRKVREYSGRGMYGRKCLGVTIDRDDDNGGLGGLIADLMEAACDDRIDSDLVIGTFRRGFTMDSMGLDMIVYFPNVPFVGTPGENEDDDE